MTERFPFGPSTRPECPPWLRLSGVLILVFVPGPLVRSAAVCNKAFVFSALPIRKVLVLDFAGASAPPLSLFSLLFSASYPQDRRSY